MSEKYFGFGYDPTESENHFYVVVPKNATDEVEIYERFHWDEGEQKITKKDILKLRLSRHKWSKLSNDVAAEFNVRLKAEKKPGGRFLVGETPVEKLFGKELMVLLWGVENNDPAGIPTAIQLSGTSDITTAFAPIVTLLPILILPRTLAPAPIVTLSPIVTTSK